MTDSPTPATVELKPEEVRAVMAAARKGGRMADAAGVSQDQLEALYTLAYNFYAAGQYEDAQTMFQGLCFYDFSDQRFLLGLGASLQAGGQFERAVTLYGMAAINTDLTDPAPVYYAAQCYLKMGRWEEAINTLKSIPVMGGAGSAESDAIKTRAAGLLEALTGGEGAE